MKRTIPEYKDVVFWRISDIIYHFANYKPNELQNHSKYIIYGAILYRVNLKIIEHYKYSSTCVMLKLTNNDLDVFHCLITISRNKMFTLYSINSLEFNISSLFLLDSISRNPYSKKMNLINYNFIGICKKFGRYAIYIFRIRCYTLCYKLYSINLQKKCKLIDHLIDKPEMIIVKSNAKSIYISLGNYGKILYNKSKKTHVFHSNELINRFDFITDFNIQDLNIKFPVIRTYTRSNQRITRIKFQSIKKSKKNSIYQMNI